MWPTDPRLGSDSGTGGGEYELYNIAACVYASTLHARSLCALSMCRFRLALVATGILQHRSIIGRTASGAHAVVQSLGRRKGALRQSGFEHRCGALAKCRVVGGVLKYLPRHTFPRRRARLGERSWRPGSAPRAVVVVVRSRLHARRGRSRFPSSSLLPTLAPAAAFSAIAGVVVVFASLCCCCLRQLPAGSSSKERTFAFSTSARAIAGHQGAQDEQGERRPRLRTHGAMAKPMEGRSGNTVPDPVQRRSPLEHQMRAEGEPAEGASGSDLLRWACQWNRATGVHIKCQRHGQQLTGRMAAVRSSADQCARQGGWQPRPLEGQRA